MPTRSDLALETVHHLYAMQYRLIDLLESADLSDPGMRREARKQVREFQELLDRADRRYMGGEDVWEALAQLPTELERKMKVSGGATIRAVAR